MSEPVPELRAVPDEAFAVGTPVTTFWYLPGERDRPIGVIVEPDQADLDRLREFADHPDEWRLVHWKGQRRRWERVTDVRVDQ